MSRDKFEMFWHLQRDRIRDRILVCDRENSIREREVERELREKIWEEIKDLPIDEAADMLIDLVLFGNVDIWK